MWKFRFENKISLLRRGGIKYMKKRVFFSIAFGCRRVNFYCHFTVSKCVILLYYVQNLGNQFNKLTAIYVLLNRYTEKIFGKLGPLPALYYICQVIYRRIFLFLDVIIIKS